MNLPPLLTAMHEVVHGDSNWTAPQRLQVQCSIVFPQSDSTLFLVNTIMLCQNVWVSPGIQVSSNRESPKS